MEVRNGYKKTEVGFIPIDWDLVALGECLNGKPEYGINAAAVPFNDTLPTYLRITDITNSGSFSTENKVSVNHQLSALYYLEDGDIVFARTGASVGKTYLYKPVDGRLVFAGFLIRIRTNKNKLLPEILKFNTQTPSYWNWVVSNSMRSGQPGLNSNEYKTLLIPVPPTLEEQTAISTALSDADALISSLEKLIAKKRNIKQGAMQQLLQPKDSWDVNKLGDVARYRRGSFPQPYGLEKWYDDINGMPFVQVFDVDDNMKLKSETKWRISEEAQKMSVFIEKGSIILTIQGSIGRIAITQYDAYVDRTLLIFENFVFPFNKYFFMLLIYILFEQEKQRAPGGTIKTITKQALSQFKISYPKIDEQNRIAEILSDMDAEITALETKLDKYRQIKQGMMQNLLTGKIRLV